MGSIRNRVRATPGSYSYTVNESVAAVDAASANISSGGGGAFSWSQKPSNYTRTLATFDASAATPTPGAGKTYNDELAYASPNSNWSQIYAEGPTGGNNFSNTTDATAPASPPNILRVRNVAGNYGTDHSNGNLGTPFTSTGSFFLGYVFKLSANWTFHPISHKWWRFELPGGNFLIQLSHDATRLRASDEAAGIAYEPQVNFTIPLNQWNVLQAVVVRGTSNNGSLNIWCNSTLVTSYSNITIAASGNFSVGSIDNHRGGGGYNQSQDEFQDIDQILIAAP